MSEGKFNCKEWLEIEIEVRDPYQQMRKMPRWERICFLMAANGGTAVVSSWGFLSGYKNGHRRGLEQDQALELIFYYGFINGLLAVEVPIHVAIEGYLTEYIKKHKIEELIEEEENA